MSGLCEHKEKVQVPSYYQDTEWCPQCGAVKGTNGLFGAKARDFGWMVPRPDKTAHETYCEWDNAAIDARDS